MFGFCLNSNVSEHGASEMAQQVKVLAAELESDSCKLSSDCHTHEISIKNVFGDRFLLLSPG